MKKILSFALALVLCFSTMAFAVVGISAAQTECEKGEHDWSAWTMVKAASDCSTPGQMERTCACGAIEYKGVSGKHSVKHVEAVSATCTEAGNIEYWQCELCGKLWTDAECTIEVESDSIGIPASNHTVEHVEAVARTCEAKGNVEYWTCSTCNLVWLDAELAHTAELSETIIPAAHTIERIEAKDAGCTESGTVEHWHCTACDKLWLDEALTQDTDAEKIITSATGHSVEHIDVKSATCVEAGNVEYWRCSICNLVWLDAELTHTAELSETIIPAAHTIERIAAKDASCTENGTVEHWHCTECNKLWLDEALSQETNADGVTSIGGHTLKHAEAKNATCEENGNIEYWYCVNCNRIELEGGVVSDKLAVQTPATHSLVKVEAKTSTCFDLGNIEYWYCSGCDWIEIEGGIASNRLAVMLPVTHNIEHVEARTATATETGNIEYWYCKDCGYAWLDESCTKNTNLKAVILPAIGEVAPPETPVEPGESADTSDVAIYYIIAIVAVAAVGSAIVFIKKREN